MMLKDSLRKKFRAVLKNISIERRREASQKACKFLLLETKHCSPVLSFFSRAEEIDLLKFNQKLSEEKRLALPLIGNNMLSIHLVEDLTLLKKGPYSIFEPDPEKCPILKISSIKAIIVPGLAFDAHNRLGQGKGYYDRLLKSFHGPTISVGFKEQHCSPLSTDEGDIPIRKIALF